MGKVKRERAVLLSGMMGSGKSSVGRALAERLGWEFIDTDERVETSCGLKIDELFRREGEAAFREREREVIESLPQRRAVVALGGGAVLSLENRASLRSKGISVWLEAKPETLALRISTEDARPLLVGATGEARIERLRELEAERGAAYAQADLRIPTDERSIEEVCAAVLAALGWEQAA
ncbi:MAG: shikimate kinase [Deltaproteobacteria bacterium]|nr:MAG: shikimate kinase [Deltaproteobacteria bacterium]